MEWFSRNHRNLIGWFCVSDADSKSGTGNPANQWKQTSFFSLLSNESQSPID